MGKILVIKNADFSANNVGVLPVYHNGSYNLTDKNYKSLLHKAPASGGVNWTAYNSSYYTYSYPVKKGSVVTLKKTINSYELFNLMLTKTEGGYSEAINYMTGKSLETLMPAYFSTSMLAPEDGYLMIEYNPTLNTFPQQALVRPYDLVDRTISESTADYGMSDYLKNDGTYGPANPPAGKKAGTFFSVFRGETVTITAQSGRQTYYCLMKNTANSYNVPPSILSGQSRQVLTAGSSVQLEIPADCLLYLLAYDGNTDYFPASVSVTRVEL